MKKITLILIILASIGSMFAQISYRNIPLSSLADNSQIVHYKTMDGSEITKPGYLYIDHLYVDRTEPKLNLPKPYGLINSKAMIITGMTSFFIAGFIQNMHTIYVIEPEYLEKKFGWKDPKTTNGEASFPFNSFLSPGKNQDHALQAATDYFVGIGSSAITVNYLFHGDGFKLQGKNTWQKIYYIAAPLVAGRVMMGLGGQASNLWIKGRLDPL